MSHIFNTFLTLPKGGIKIIFDLLNAPLHVIKDLTGRQLQVASYYATFVVLALTTTVDTELLKEVIKAKIDEEKKMAITITDLQFNLQKICFVLKELFLKLPENMLMRFYKLQAGDQYVTYLKKLIVNENKEQKFEANIGIPELEILLRELKYKQFVQKLGNIKLEDEEEEDNEHETAAPAAPADQQHQQTQQ